MPTLTMTKGLPASGKTTWAKEQVLASNGRTKRINKDDLRAMIDAGKWSKQNETLILIVRDALISTFLGAGYDVIVDDTNLAPKHKAQLQDIALLHGVNLNVKDFTDVPLEECIKRDQNRPNYVGEKVIRGMYNSFLKPKVDVAQSTAPVFDPELPSAIICDIDGTLAHMNGRSPYDWKRVGEDAVDKSIRDIVNSYYNQRVIMDETPRVTIVLMSGRDGSCRPETEQWLKDNRIKYDLLYMRTDGDSRKDSTVKEELFEANVRGKYNVLFVLDDRNQMVDKWRSMGLKCLQVAYGDF